VFILNAENAFTQLSSFSDDHIETFDWSPTEDKIAIAVTNSIQVFGGSFDAHIQTYENIFEADPDGKRGDEIESS
jgi:hypothetical protein